MRSVQAFTIASTTVCSSTPRSSAIVAMLALRKGVVQFVTTDTQRLGGLAQSTMSVSEPVRPSVLAVIRAASRPASEMACPAQAMRPG